PSSASPSTTLFRSHDPPGHDDAGDGWAGVPRAAAGRSLVARDPRGGIERPRRRRFLRRPDGRRGVLAKADRPARAARDRRAFLRARRLVAAAEGGLPTIAFSLYRYD